jgi:hypothetical protein
MARKDSKKIKRNPSRNANNFESVAKRLGCDEDKARLEAKLGKIARAKPSKSR